MAAEVGLEAPDLGLAALAAELEADPTAFEFVQAVRLLERLHANRSSPGKHVDPAHEAVRFAAHAATGFPASEIQRYIPARGGPALMEVNFFGLTGPQGLLPREYTLLAAERRRARDGALADFLDLFNHRAISFLYRAWRKHHVVVARERGEADPILDHVLDLVGLGTPAMRAAAGVGEDVLAEHAGLLAAMPRSAVVLEQLLDAAFGVPVEVQQFVGGWFTVEESDLCRLGDESASSTLGRGAVVGDEVWDPQARVRIRMGPLHRDQYDAFLPAGRHHEQLAALLRFFAHDQFEFELQLVLRAEDVPGCVLGDDTGAQRLGWSTWLRPQPLPEDATDTLITLSTSPRRKDAA